MHRSIHKLYIHLHVYISVSAYHSVLNYIQIKLKEEKEAKRATLDSRHNFIIDALLTKIDVHSREVEEVLLDRSNLGHVEDFFAANGTRCLLFYYEEKRSEDGEYLHHRCVNA